MKQRVYLILFIIVALGLTSFYFPNHLKAESKQEEIKRKIAEIDAKRKATLEAQKKLENNIQEVQKEQKEIRAEITRLDLQLNELAKEIEQKEEEIESTKQQLEEVSVRLDEAIARVEEREELLKKRVRAIYETGDVSYLEVLLDSSSIGDFLSRLDMVEKIVESDKSILAENIKDKEEIEANKKEIENLLALLEEQYNNLTEKQQEFQRKLKERTVAVASLQKEEENLQKEIEKTDNDLKKLASDRSKLQEQLRKISYSGGQLLWPLPDSTRITDTFGPRIHPVTGKKSTHTGIDIGAPTGTDIVAAESGVVILAAYYGAYGNTVMIDHGSGLVTMYGHIRNGGIKVKEGQEVKRGQKIAEVGSTGLSTGPHLHFSVIKDGEYQDPMKYLKSK